jgi:hypothetical protein
MVMNVRGYTEATGVQHEGSTEIDIVLATPLKLDLSWSGPSFELFWYNIG